MNLTIKHSHPWFQFILNAGQESRPHFPIVTATVEIGGTPCTYGLSVVDLNYPDPDDRGAAVLETTWESRPKMAGTT